MVEAHEVLMFLHLTAVFIFLIAHGTSAAVAFRLRKEREPAKVVALLDVSGSTLLMMGLGWIFVLITGIALGVEIWLRVGAPTLWFWASIIVLIVITALMTPLSRGYLKARAALGVKPSMLSAKSWEKLLAKGYTRDKLDTYLKESNPMALAAVGFGGILVLMFLMMFKPF